jgi:zinc D-Ala-D-Ala dipeptidase
MKKYLNTKQAIVDTPLSERWKYYIARDYFTTITIKENKEILTDAKTLTDAGILIEPIWEDAQLDEEGTAYVEYLLHKPLPGWVREGVAKRLMNASAVLSAEGYRLVLKAGFRPLQVQKKLFDDVLAGFRLKYPMLKELELIEMTRDYVSDPSQIVPPHTAGSAVDVALRDTAGNLVDMGCAVNQGEDIAWTDYPGLSAEQLANRKCLRDAMLSAGFAPLGSEWWHYSYGDQIWSAYYQKPLALYGIYDND